MPAEESARDEIQCRQLRQEEGKAFRQAQQVLPLFQEALLPLGPEHAVTQECKRQFARKQAEWFTLQRRLTERLERKRDEHPIGFSQSPVAPLRGSQVRLGCRTGCLLRPASLFWAGFQSLGERRAETTRLGESGQHYTVYAKQIRETGTRLMSRYSFEQRTEKELGAERLKRAYAGLKDCGCLVAVVVDEPSFKTEVAEAVSEWIREGLTILPMTVEEANQRLKPCQCG
jgi:hypothetical protein